MKQFPLLELLSTKLFVWTALFILVAVPFVFVYLLDSRITDLDRLASFVDATFKTVALLIATVWALNRYYTTRTDASQLRVDSEVTCIPTSCFRGVSKNRSLLIYRLDIVNTGKTLIGPFRQFVEVQTANPTDTSVEYTTIGRWPQEGMHPGGPIEPGSWSAINNAMSIPASLQAVRIFIGMDLDSEGSWTWHKTFDISKQQQSV